MAPESRSTAPLAGLRARWPYGLVIAAVVLGDQVTKAWVVDAIALREIRPVIPGFFDLTHLLNTGGVWGLGRALPSGGRILVFLAVPSIITAVAIWYSLNVLGPRDRWRQAAVAMIVGGAIGNLIDRVRLQHVIDFLLFHVGRYYWPAFNVADIAICVGVGVLFVAVLREDQGGPDEDD